MFPFYEQRIIPYLLRLFIVNHPLELVLCHAPPMDESLIFLSSLYEHVGTHEVCTLKAFILELIKSWLSLFLYLSSKTPSCIVGYADLSALMQVLSATAPGWKQKCCSCASPAQIFPAGVGLKLVSLMIFSETHTTIYVCYCKPWQFRINLCG